MCIYIYTVYNHIKAEPLKPQTKTLDQGERGASGGAGAAHLVLY